MKIVYSLLFLAGCLAALFATGCDSTNDNAYVEKLILQGRMTVGHAPEIRIAHTLPIEAYYDSSRVGVSGASVTLTAGSTVFHLAENANDPRGAGYYRLAAGDTHTVTPGLAYSIHVESNGHVLDAETRAAGFFHITEQNLDTIMIGVEELRLRWTHDSLARGVWMIMENLNPHRADDSTLLDNNNNGDDKMIGIYTQYWNTPPTADTLRVPWVLFNRSGLHRVRLLTCDNALWFYSQTYQPLQTDVVPQTNVRGGLGVFSAGDEDTTYFYMRKNPAID
jgi:hypothetical protein